MLPLSRIKGPIWRCSSKSAYFRRNCVVDFWLLEHEGLFVGRIINRLTAIAVAAAIGLAGLSSDAAEDARTYKLQLGVGHAKLYNLEEPFLDIAKLRDADWTFELRGKGRLGPREAIAAGYLDPTTYLPTPKSRETKSVAIGVVLSGAEDFKDYYADDYVLDWRGEAYGHMLRWPKNAEKRRTSNSVEYTLTGATAKGGALRFSDIGEGFTGFRFYRKKYAALIERGEIWNPAFIDLVRRYDIVRTMDFQSTNNELVRRFDQIAKMNDPWGQGASMAWPEAPYFGMPYEVLFNLGVKADVTLWMTLPPQIGSPISSADPSLRRKDRPGYVDAAAFQESARAHASETLASSEWDVFAKEFTDRYVASGYPLSRPLYLEVGNEVWNFARGFYVGTNYAIGLAKGVNPEWSMRQGYGVLVARYMMALEKEFARRKIRPNVIYVVGSHVANPWRTKQALDGVTDYLKMNGVDPKPFLARTGVAVTNYYGKFDSMSEALFGTNKPAVYAPQWIAEIEKDPDALARRIEKLLVEGPDSVKSTGPWIVARWAEHKAFADKAGSRFIGAYEGGSHLLPPKELEQSPKFMAWWMAWHWSAGSADVARRINQQLIAAYPDAIIANYLSVGAPSVKAPWIDGHYARPTPMSEMWLEFAKPAAAQ